MEDQPLYEVGVEVSHYGKTEDDGEEETEGKGNGRMQGINI